MKKIFSITGESGKEVKVKIRFSTYKLNNTVALMLYNIPAAGAKGVLKDPYAEVYGVATRSFPESCDLNTDEQFIDENNMPGIGRWLEENGIASPTGKALASGFCTYPVYKFNVPARDRKRLHLQ